MTYRDGVFLVLSAIEDRPILKTAGFSYHLGSECPAGPRTCSACKAEYKKGWWTKRPEVAVRISRFADPLATARLAKHVQAVAASRATDSEIVIPHPPKLFGYLPFQKAGIAFMTPREATLLGDEPGLGKTIQVLGVINNIPEIKSALIICPATLRTNWLKEAQKWLVDDGRTWRYHVVDEDEAIPEKANFVISNYNRISIGYKKCEKCDGQPKVQYPCPKCNGTGNGEKHPTLCSLCAGKKTVPCDLCRSRGKKPEINIKIIDSLMARTWDIAAFDEAHFVKNPRAERTRAVIGHPAKRRPGLCERAKKKIFMTGTPLPNKPVEMWPLLSVCAPKEFGNFRAFTKRYCDAHEEHISKTKTVLKVGGASNLEELQERLRSTVLIRRLKADVLKDLPPKIRQIVPLVPTAAAKKLIGDEMDIWQKKAGEELSMAQEALAVAQEENNKEAYESVVMRLQQIQKVAFFEMAKIRHEVAVAKLPSVIHHLEGMFREGIKKIICFAHHKDVVKGIVERFSDRTVSLVGDTKKEDRDTAVTEFQTNPKIMLFVGSLGAAGTGITLTASSYVVFAELDWVPSNVTQGEDRAHRIGQKNTVNVQHLVLDGSLDARMAQMLVEKQDIADRALDKTTTVHALSSLLETRPEGPVEPVPTWKKLVLKRAMIELAQRRDPSVEGSHGFSSFDSNIGQKLATLKWDYSDKQAHLAITLTKKYRRQLSDETQKQLGLFVPLTPAEERKLRFGPKSGGGMNQKINPIRPVAVEQTALDFVMGIRPGGDEKTDLIYNDVLLYRERNVA